MKVLIWAGCIVLGVVLNYMLMQVIGFGLGQALLFVVIVFVAKKLCAEYDKQKAADSARKTEATGHETTVYETTGYYTPTAISSDDAAPLQNSACVCPICGEQFNNNIFCPKCGAKVR